MDDPIEINRRNCARRSTPRRLSAMRLAVCGRAKMRFSRSKAELGDISGKRVLHLQCHIGRDTLGLARRGAVVTGLDFSPAAIECARRLSMESGLTATFIQGSVDQTPRLVLVRSISSLRPGVSSAGCPTCAPGEVVASVLAPGGELYCADAHPSFVALEEQAGRLLPTFDFQLLPTGRGNSSIPSRRPTWAIRLRRRIKRHGCGYIHCRPHSVRSSMPGLALPWRRCVADVTVRPTIALSGNAQNLVPATDRLWRLRAYGASVGNRRRNMDEDEDMDIDGLQRKVSLTLVGELYSLIGGTPDEELEASLLEGLYEVVALQAEPNKIMRLTDRLLSVKRKKVQGLVEGLAELHQAAHRERARAGRRN